MNIISITDENDIIYEFKQPHFKCTLLAVVGKCIIGYTTNSDQSIIDERKWDFDGTDITAGHFDLTPIKQPWYKTCKFPCLIWVPSRCEFDVITNHLQIQGPDCRPATGTEALSLVHHD